MVGERFAGDGVLRSDAMIVRFVVLGPAGEIRVQGRDGADPAGLALLGGPGLYIAGYRSKPSPVELEAGKFEAYLQREGLDAISSLRAARGRATSPDASATRAAPRRCSRSGRRRPSRRDAPLGFTLELVAEKNPYALAPGDELPLRLTYDGAPIAGVLVTAFSKEHPGSSVAARTDKEGRVKLRLASPGIWLAKAVHMIPLPAGEDAQFESFWASLTFALGAAGKPRYACRRAKRSRWKAASPSRISAARARFR